MSVQLRDLLSVSEAQSRGVSALVQDAEQGRTRVILRHSKPAAAVVSIARLERMEEIEEDLMLMVATLARMMVDTGRRHSLDDVAAEFGVDLDDDDEDCDETEG